MSRRLLTSIVFVLCVTPFLAGQTRQWTPPRTADGQPDLQGYWTNATYTPLERPKNVTKELTSLTGCYTANGVIVCQTVPLFSGGLSDFYWQYDNNGLKLAQLRFYLDQ